MTATPVPYAKITPADPDGPVLDPTRSYVGGYPYMPPGSWPVDNGTPMTFLIQVNFAEVPPLPDFPTSGLLQWFVGADDLYGLDFDDGSHGRSGLVTRWYSADDLTQPVPHRPIDQPPLPPHPEFTPLLLPHARPVEFTLATETPQQYGLGDKVGGTPGFTQGDPREHYPTESPRLLIQLDSTFTAWGDSGTAQLFGDPTALAHGDLSSLWWDWACA